MNAISLLPHGKDIVAIKEVIHSEKNSICCEIESSGSEFKAVEYIAQAAAVGRILNSTQQVKLGMIIRIKEFVISSENKCLYVECTWSDSVAGAYEVLGKALDENKEVVAQAVITMMEQV